MREILPGIFVIAIFILAFADRRLVSLARQSVGHARHAASVVMAPDLDDEQKERLVQAAALKLFANLLRLLLLLAIVIATASLPVLAAHYLGYASISDIGRWLARPDVILLSTAAAIAAYVLVIRKRTAR